MGKIGAYAKNWTTQHFQKVRPLRKNENSVINSENVKKSFFFSKKKLARMKFFFIFQKMKKHDDF